jgi:hypothetical protein
VGSSSQRRDRKARRARKGTRSEPESHEALPPQVNSMDIYSGTLEAVERIHEIRHRTPPNYGPWAWLLRHTRKAKSEG